jgi:Short C-terminal domain
MPGLLRAMGRTAVVAGTATAVSNRVSRRQANRWAEQEAQEAPPQQYYEQAPPQQAPPPAAEPEGPDLVEQLTQLAELKDKGILTEEEFAQQKAKLLA